MPADLPTLLRLVGESIAAPRRVADAVVQARAPRSVLLEGVVLVAALSALVVALLGTPVEGDVVFPPLVQAALVAASLVLSATALQAAGQILGGRGHFDEALAIVVWLEVVALAVSLAQAAARFAAPSLSTVATVVGVAVLLWCLVNFVHVLHGFAGFGRTVATLALATAFVAVGMTLLFSLLAGMGWVPDA